MDAEQVSAHEVAQFRSVPKEQPGHENHHRIEKKG